jgi:hypothetical protein
LKVAARPGCKIRKPIDLALKGVHLAGDLVVESFDTSIPRVASVGVRPPSREREFTEATAGATERHDEAATSRICERPVSNKFLSVKRGR